MSQSLDELLARCLEDIQAGRSTVEACLARYPAQRAELEALLRTAQWVAQAEAARPDPAFRAAAKTRLLNRIRAEGSARDRGGAAMWAGVVTWGGFPRLWGWMRTLWMAQQAHRSFAMVWSLAWMILAFFVGGGGVAYASTQALPDDTLYPVKLAVEEVQLLFADTDEDVQLHLAFAQRRLDEAQAMAREGRVQDLKRALRGYESHARAALRLAEQLSQTDPRWRSEVIRQVERQQAHLRDMAQMWQRERLLDPEQVPEVWSAFEAPVTSVPAIESEAPSDTPEPTPSPTATPTPPGDDDDWGGCDDAWDDDACGEMPEFPTPPPPPEMPDDD